MKIFGENQQFIIVNKNENLKVVYSVYSNTVLALNNKAMEIFESIIDNAQSNDGEIEKVCKKYGEEDVIQFLDTLNKCRILFKSREEMENADFYLTYVEKKKVDIHKAYLHLTQKCNLRCKYCYNANNIGKTEDMNTETWKQIFHILKEKGFRHVVFTGGEVLLRKDLLELAQYAKHLDFELSILTNGTVELTKELIETADTIEISLDSLDDDINEINRVKSSKFHVTENIYKIPFKLRKKIVIKTVLSNSNANFIVNMRDELEKIGFEKIEIILQQPNNPYETNIYPDVVVPRKAHKFDLGRISKCNACYEIIAINSNGDIYPCQALIKEDMLITSIFNDNWFEKIKKSGLMDIFFNCDINNTECKECPFKYLCGGPCKAVSYNLTGSLLEGRGEYCEHAKMECIEYLRSIEFGGI